MKPPDYTLYLWLWGLAALGHFASFLFIAPDTAANAPPRPFPWRRLLISMPVCFILGLAGATVAGIMGWNDTVRDGLAACFGYGGTALISALLQTAVDRIKWGNFK